jgi:hypothetical protein
MDNLEKLAKLDTHDKFRCHTVLTGRECVLLDLRISLI